MPILQMLKRANAWNPMGISDLGLWLEADQGVTLVGSKVSQWDDLSGNNREFTQSDDALRPTHESEGLNGLPCLYFDQNQILDRVNDTLIRNVDGATVIAVYQSSGTTTNGQCLFYFCKDTNTQRFVSWQSQNSQSGNIYGRRLDADGAQSSDIATNFFPIDTACTYTWIADWANGAAYLRRNGTQLAGDTTWGTAGYTSDTNSYLLSLGGLGSSYRMYGRLAAFLVYRRKLSPTELVTIEGQCTTKYGITGS